MKTFFTRLALLLTISVPAFVFAASPFLKPVKDLLGDLEIFINFLSWALPAVGVLIFFLLVVTYISGKMGFPIAKIWGGGGEGKEGVQGKGLFWALVGLAVMFAVYGLIQLIGALFGIDTNRAKTITAPSLPQVGGISGGSFYSGGGGN
jgi:hypothetical protein